MTPPADEVNAGVDVTSAIDAASRRPRTEAADLGLLWAVATILGIGAIAFVPVAPASRHPWLRMAIPVVVMVGYAVVGWQRRSVNRQRVADSLYFMGFLWTLWALIHALLSAPEPTSQIIYTAFGYALIGTFAGMGLRLMLMQFSRDLDLQEQEAADQIDDRVAELDKALDSATAAVTAFSTSLSPTGELRKQLTMATTAIADQAKQSALGVTEKLNAGIAESTEKLSGALSAVASHSTRIALELEKARLELTPSGQELTKAIRKLAGGTQRQADLLETAIGQLVAAVECSSKDPRIQQALETVVGQLKDLGGAVEGASVVVSSAAGRVTESEVRFSGALGSASAVVTEASGAVSAAAKELVSASAQAGTASDTLAAKASAARQQIDGGVTALREVVEFVDKHVKDQA